jgi:hypothetical protein
MKKIKWLLVALATSSAFSMNAFAASGNLSVSSGSVYVGDSFTATVKINSAAAWNVHVSASGPVSGCTINQANATDDALDTNTTFSTTCTATGKGTITLVLSGDVTSASNGNAVNISGSKTVTVADKPTPPSNNDSNNGGSSNNNNNNNSGSGNSRPSNTNDIPKNETPKEPLVEEPLEKESQDETDAEATQKDEDAGDDYLVTTPEAPNTNDAAEEPRPSVVFIVIVTVIATIALEAGGIGVYLFIKKRKSGKNLKD